MSLLVFSAVLNIYSSSKSVNKDSRNFEISASSLTPRILLSSARLRLE